MLGRTIDAAFKEAEEDESAALKRAAGDDNDNDDNDFADVNEEVPFANVLDIEACESVELV